MSNRLGNFRAIYLAALCCIGSFLFAYDTGIVGGVLTLSAFEDDFRYTKAQSTNINSNCVSILQAGAFFGCFLVWPITERIGRRFAIMGSSLVFCLGGILQVVNTHSIGAFYAGRVISGFGVGAATVLVPMFSAEMSPKSMRGTLGSFFQLFFSLGVCVSYWYGFRLISQSRGCVRSANNLGLGLITEFNNTLHQVRSSGRFPSDYSLFLALLSDSVCC